MTSKFKNQRCEYQGQSFRSKRELQRFLILQNDLSLGVISDLRREVPFELAPKVMLDGRCKPALRYFADFVYNRGGVTVVEDAKGVQTPVYRIKKHLMKTVHGINVKEV